MDELQERAGDQLGRRIAQCPFESRVDPGEARRTVGGAADEQQVGRDGEEALQFAAADFQLGRHRLPVTCRGQQRLERGHDPMDPQDRGHRHVLGDQQRAGVFGAVFQRDGHLLRAGSGLADRQRRVRHPQHTGEPVTAVVEGRRQCRRAQHHSRQIG